MQLASSLYRGGELVSACEADYDSSRELGLICPFCREAVFLTKGFIRTVRSQEQKVCASWKHYRVKTDSVFCERRALSPEGRKELKQLQKTAQNQRLRLFNKRFWDIFKHKKVIPHNLRSTCLLFISAEQLDLMVKHCQAQWHVDQIIQCAPKKIIESLGNPSITEALKNHPSLHNIPEDSVNNVVADFTQVKFTVLRHKILAEVIAWLATPSAYSSFAKLIYLSMIDSVEVLEPPIHSQNICEMAIFSLVLTDWEQAIASLDSQTKGIGFG